MLNITLIYLGAQKDSYFRNAMDEYIKRISKYAVFSEKVLKCESLPENPSQSEINVCLEKEAKSIISAIPKGVYTIAMCIEGKQMSSEELAKTFEGITLGGKSGICFIIGSSHGLSNKVKDYCSLRLSVSKMTFAHGLFGVILCEQIYRALTINAGEKYHK